MRYRKVTICAAAVLLLATSVWAEEMSNCAAIEKADERLACYDRVSGQSAAPAVPESAVDSPPA